MTELVTEWNVVGILCDGLVENFHRFAGLAPFVLPAPEDVICLDGLGRIRILLNQLEERSAHRVLVVGAGEGSAALPEQRGVRADGVCFVEPVDGVGGLVKLVPGKDTHPKIDLIKVVRLRKRFGVFAVSGERRGIVLHSAVFAEPGGYGECSPGLGGLREFLGNLEVDVASLALAALLPAVDFGQLEFQLKLLREIRVTLQDFLEFTDSVFVAVEDVPVDGGNVEAEVAALFVVGRVDEILFVFGNRFVPLADGFKASAVL